MTGYIVSLLGIVIISVLVELMLPSGETAKYIKSILAVFVIYVLVNPIITFFKSDFNLDKYVNSTNINIDETLLKDLYKEQSETRAQDLENMLYEQGYKGVKIKLIYKIVEHEIIFEKAVVNIDELVITGTNTNINKYDYIRQQLTSNLLIKEENIVFEW